MKAIRSFLVFVLVLALQNACAQYHDAKWVLCQGDVNLQSNVILDFSNGQNPQVQISNSFISMAAENASVSDPAGNLLFFTNGIHIYDKNLNYIPGGDLVLPYDTVGSYLGLAQRQGCMFLPWPGDSNKYVLLHTTKELPLQLGSIGWIPYHLPSHLYFSILNKNLNSGNGGIVSINQVLLYDTLSNWAGGLAVTKHANGRDWWIVVKKHYRNKFYKFLLTPSGIQNMGFQNIGLDNQARLLDSYSFGPNGEVLAGVIEKHKIALFNFDRCTGLLSNYQMIVNPSAVNYWCEDIDFSSNSKVLYSNEVAKIFQYDLTNINTPGTVQSTQMVIADTSWTTLMCDSPGAPIKNLFPWGELAANGKIYYPSNSFCPELTYIDQPDSLGLPCLFNYQGINIINLNTSAIPYFPNYRLGPVVGSICDSITGINQLATTSVSVYPNPVKDKLFITLSREFKNLTVALFNLQSQQLVKVVCNSTNLVLNLDPALTNGIYFLVIRSNDGLVSKKIIIDR